MSSVPTCSASDASDVDLNRERVVFNVGGVRFETYRKTLTPYPRTLLGAMFSENNRQLLKPGPDNEFFFDRDPDCFKIILNFYRTGRIFIPPNIHEELCIEELNYFQIPIKRSKSGKIVIHNKSSEQTVLCTWGRGDFGQLGHGDRSSLCSPKLVEFFARLNVRSVSLGTSHTCCVTSNNEAYSWGYGGDGRLGLGDENDRLVPTLIEAFKDIEIKDIICGELHSAAVAYSGQVFTWGLGKDGRLGLGSRESVLLPKIVENLYDSKIVQVACGGLHTAALSDRGEMFTWGLGKNGRLGLGDEDDRLYPTKVGIHDVTYIACGGHHTGVIDYQGGVHTWGFDDDGRLGHLETGHRLLPTPVESLLGSKIVQLSLGCWHSAALDSNGTVYTWGSCKSGQLGQSHKNSMPIPQATLSGKNAIKVACGTAHTAALCADGTLYTWGKSDDGRLGYESVADQVTPRKVDNSLSSLTGIDVVCGVYNTACICIEE